MPLTYIVGNDGNATVKIGTTTQTIFKVRQYSATLARTSTDLTGFGDTGRRRRLGIIDLTGSLTAALAVDASQSPTTNGLFTQTFDYVSTTSALTLTLDFYSSGTNSANLVTTAVFSQFGFSNDKSGEASVSANFENANGVAPTVTWMI